MTFRQWVFLLIFALGVSACSQATPTVEPTATLQPSPTATLAQPSVHVTSAPDPVRTAQSFFEAWEVDNYVGMYSLLTLDSQAGISQEDFEAAYLDMAVQAAIPTGAVDARITAHTIQTPSAHLDYTLVLTSNLFGSIQREHGMDLVLDGGEWRIRWDVSLILPDLTDGRTLRRVPWLPERGSIFDRNGDPIVAQADAYSLGIIPAEIPLAKEGEMLSLLSRVTGLAPEYLFLYYAAYGYQADFYIPITDVQADLLNPYFDPLNSFDAVIINAFTSRYYFNNGLAPQTIGYVSAVQPDEVNPISRDGYWWTSRLARTGVELWAEESLSGRRGGQLMLDNADGGTSVLLGETPFGPSEDVYVTIDSGLQQAAQSAMLGFRGSIVVMERDTGRVLAMASAPNYSPNLFSPENYNALWDTPLDDDSNPLFNRATRGLYPLGSVFKIVTLSAALESGLFKPEDTYDCQFQFNEIPGITLWDWTIEYFDVPSGILNLQEGLMRSCNPWFYHIGLTLFQEGFADLIPELAAGFGLGSPTGIVGVEQEAAGHIPGAPTEALEATNLAIGQGDLEVTPIQVAALVAAVGNNGSLLQPQLIERVVDFEGNVVYEFAPEVVGSLPISPENLALVQEAMGMVVGQNRGTAYWVFGNFTIPVAGKTGTSEVGGGLEPHAWFAVYTDENNPDRPDIVVVAILENGGDGGDIAAPVVRRVLEHYYFGRPRTQYPWETRIGVWDDWVQNGETVPEE
jgi:penicillin-binding protein 2